MNIYVKHGDKVVFAYPENGYTHDINKAKQYLTKGKVYTIERTEVHPWTTDVYLTEHPRLYFNSIHFEDYKEDNHDKNNNEE